MNNKITYKKRESKSIDPSKFKLLKTIAKNVKFYRIKLNLSQELLSEQCDLHRNFVNLLENNKTNISITNLELIAKALKISLADLITEHKLI